MADIIDIKVHEEKSFFNIPKNYNKKVIYGIPKSSTGRKEDDEDTKNLPSKLNTTKKSNKLNKSKTKIQPKEPLTNAEILWRFEHGSPAKDIEGRPLLGPVRDNNLEIIQKKFFSKIFEALIQGDETTADKYMQDLALFMQRECYAYFVSGKQNPKWKENADSTIRAWALDSMRKDKSLTYEEATNKTVGIWTAQMRNSLRGVVVEDKD